MNHAIARPNDPLFSAFRIKKLVLKNRIMSTSHASGLHDKGFPGDAYQAYHEEKVKGGLALTMFGGSSNVAVDSPSVFEQLNVGDDKVIPYLQRFSERIHRHDAALMCQITHLGRRGSAWAGQWLPMVAPSPIRETLHRSFPKEMDRHDITRIVRAYGDAALRCFEGGLDGIETMASSHLIGQFLSPLTNMRTDEFGGSLVNRCRFGLLVHEEIRRRVGDDWIVGLRVTVDENDPGGIGFEEAVKIARIFESSGTIDFFNAMWGRMDTVRALADENMPGMDIRAAPWLKAVSEFRKEVALPVFHAAKISDVATARYAISEGLVDMIAMTRAHIADPHIVTKIMNGDENRIRPCVGATHCMSAQKPKCIHNAATGRELVFSHDIKRAEKPKTVIVIGGGPAGLEAARVSAERGHKVTLLEAGSKLGGQLILASMLDWRKDMSEIIEWRRNEIEHLGVEVRLNFFAEAYDIRSLDPDVVIIATGGMPDLEFPGGDFALSAWDLISGTATVSGSVVVFDGTGRQPALLAAVAARKANCPVKLVTIDGQICEEAPYAEKSTWKRRMHQLEVEILTDWSLERVSLEGIKRVAHLINETDHSKLALRADHIVVERGTQPLDDLYKELVPHSCNDGVTDYETLVSARSQPSWPGEGFELHRIGDAVASRNAASAITDAFRLCYSI